MESYCPSVRRRNNFHNNFVTTTAEEKQPVTRKQRNSLSQKMARWRQDTTASSPETATTRCPNRQCMVLTRSSRIRYKYQRFLQRKWQNRSFSTNLATTARSSPPPRCRTMVGDGMVGNGMVGTLALYTSKYCTRHSSSQLVGDGCSSASRSSWRGGGTRSTSSPPQRSGALGGWLGSSRRPSQC